MSPDKPDGSDEHGDEVPTWSVVANVLIDRLHGGAELRHGTKHFAPGAKVYVIGAFWGMGAESVIVVGHHRKSRRYICINIKSAHLTNWRVGPVYSPTVLALISKSRDRSTTGSDRERLQAIAASFAANRASQPFVTRPPQHSPSRPKVP